MGVLAGRNIFLTGASSGVGRHIARMMAGEGAQVVCCARRRTELNAVVDEITEAGGTAFAKHCDVSDAASIKAAFDAAEDSVGFVDSVIVNAGINYAGPATQLAVSDLDQIIAVNFRGAFLTACEGAKRMIARGVPSEKQPRRIVFVASILGRRAQKGTAIYGATKAGVLMLAKTLALEWARHDINVNAVCPGYMPTEIVASWFESAAGKSQIAGWPRQRLLPVEDLDPAILFLLSPASRSITGGELTVDDAQSLS